ncbi:MAG: glycosyltransferase involved in cell wall biosynthesis [Glaciecola sp.]
MFLQSNNKKKICLVVSSLGKGGAERSSALLSVLLDQLEYDVHIIYIVNNNIDYPYKGKLLNLGLLKEKSDRPLNRLKRFFVFRSYVKKHRFDFIIDNRTRNSTFRELLISFAIYDLSKTIFLVRSFKISSYFPNHKSVAKYIYKKAYKVVGVSNEIVDAIQKKYHLTNVTCIYNPIQVFDYQEEQIDFDYILAYGRLDDKVKNYSFLIEAYKRSKLPDEKIKLIVLGEGKDENKLKNLVNSLALNDFVKFFPFQKNPSGFIKKAKFVCLTSRVEGFPRVLIESLSLGTPVISVNCKSGPKEIVKHKINGLLIKEYNTKAFAEGMDLLIFDKDFYDICKQNASKSVLNLTLDSISIQWKKLLNQL